MPDIQRSNGPRGAAAERFRTTHDIVGIKGEAKEDSLLRSIENGDFEQFKNGLDKLKNHLQENPKEYQRALKELSERLTKSDERGGLTRRREQLDPATAGEQLTRLAEFIDRAENRNSTVNIVGSEPAAEQVAVVIPPLPQPHVTARALNDLKPWTPTVTPKTAEPGTETHESIVVKEAVDATAKQAPATDAAKPSTAPHSVPALLAREQADTISSPQAATPEAEPAATTSTVAKSVQDLIADSSHSLERERNKFLWDELSPKLSNLSQEQFVEFLESKTTGGKDILPLVATLYSTNTEGTLEQLLAKQMPQAFERATTLTQAIDRYWFNDQETFANTLSGVGNTPEEKKRSNEELQMVWQLLRGQKLEDAIGVELDPDRATYALNNLNGSNNDGEIVQAKKTDERLALERFMPSYK